MTLSLATLKEKIERKESRLGVIGLGYVGLPVAATFASTGFDVCGVDLDAERIDQISQGKSPIEGNEPGLDELIYQVVKSGKLTATTDYSQLRECDVILICVETPVDSENIPRYNALRSALVSLGAVLKSGALVIIESTIAPRTMDELVLPTLENASNQMCSRDFFLGNCPERVMPGKLLTNLRHVNRVAGGMTPETAEVMICLYHHILDADIDPTDCLTGELVKTTENAYRDVQIAFANEVAKICEAAGADVWKLRELVNKSPGRQMHLPGGGVGGHCIPKDSWLLAYGAKDKDVDLQILPAARHVNDSMPMHVGKIVEKTIEAAGTAAEDARVLIMGYAYLEDSDDTRNSPSKALVEYLKQRGISCNIHDPYVKEYSTTLEEVAQGCCAAVIMVRHQEYLQLDWAAFKSWLAEPILVDARHVIDLGDAQKMGFIYRGVGVGEGSKPRNVD